MILIPVRRVTCKILIRMMSMSRNKQSDKTIASRR
ncbi:MAG: hypothetical protein QOG12_2202 [Verrucomicrobiota bacterium]|jgi:hypothetical protein